MRAQLRGDARKDPGTVSGAPGRTYGFDESHGGGQKIHRLWKEEGLQVRRAPQRKRAGQSSDPILVADAPKVARALDL